MNKKKELNLRKEMPEKNLADLSTIFLEKSTYQEVISELVEKAVELTHSDLGAYYLLLDSGKRKERLKLVKQNFRRSLPDFLSIDSELVEFILESRETVLFLSSEVMPEEDFIGEIILHPSQKSGLALPVKINEEVSGIFFINSKKNNFYNNSRFRLLENIAKLASGILENITKEEGAPV